MTEAQLVEIEERGETCDECFELAGIRKCYTCQDRDALCAALRASQERERGSAENADALAVRLGVDPDGMSAAEIWHASAAAIEKSQERERDLESSVAICAVPAKEINQTLTSLRAKIEKLQAALKGVMPYLGVDPELVSRPKAYYEARDRATEAMKEE